MALALVVVPLLFALLAMAVPADRHRGWVVVCGALAHSALTAAAVGASDVRGLGGWLGLDPLGRLVLTHVSLLFLACAAYARGYVRAHPERNNRVLVACMLALLGAMTLSVLAQHLGLMWVALETTSLAAAPMLYYKGDARSLEAVWKYLLVGSVGIALALLGSLFLGYAAVRGGVHASLIQGDLVRHARELSAPWLRFAFVVLFVGYGTKLGLAPMHTWKPDAYGEAPGVVGALLAGGLTSCAFVAILRFFQIVHAAGLDAFPRQLMVWTGALSMVIAGVFMVRQKDLKRLLAYSSVEHMGILVLGVGLGGAGVFGSMLHMLNNALIKGAMFMSAANVQRTFGGKTTDEVRGALQRAPGSAALLLVGLLAVTGTPPFGPFLSELTILRGAVDGARWAVVAVFLGALVVVFLGMSATVLQMVQGDPPDDARAAGEGDRFWTLAPGVALAVLVLALGVWIPRPVDALVRGAAQFLERTP